MQSQRRHGIPGRTCPGLIEAPLSSRGGTRDTSIPGRTCPGLIEALSGSCGSSPSVPVFRGEPAPASLKQQLATQQLRQGNAYSGANLPRPH